MACCGCLAMDIRLISLKDTNLYDEFIKIVALPKFSKLDHITFNLCWLCHARLKGFIKFRDDCRESMANLLNYSSDKITGLTGNQYIAEIRKKYKFSFLSINAQTFSYEFTNDNFSNNGATYIYHEHFEQNSDNVFQQSVKNEKDGGKESQFTNIKAELMDENFDEHRLGQSIIDQNVEVNIKLNRQEKVHNVNKIATKRAFRGPIKTFVLETVITRDQQLKELETIRNSKEFIKAPYKCDVCVKGFYHDIVYKKHCLKHESVCGQHVCELCSQHFNTLRNLSNHLDTHARRYTCRLCSKIFVSKQNVMSHMYIKHDEMNKEVKCDQCNRIYKNRYTYAKHMRVHNSSKEHKCHLCPKVFLWKDNLNRHLTRHTNEKPFKCEKCSKMFYFKENLKDHQLVHSVNKKFYCAECNLSYASQIKLNQHLRRGSRHIQPHQLTFACKLCEKRYTNNLQLTAHIDSIHLNKRSHVCQLCEAAFVNKKSLKVHTRNIHEGYKKPRKHICETCGKRFAETKVLQAHIRTHTGEKPYSCKYCNVKFAHSGARYTHIRLVHLKLKRGISKNKKNLKSDSTSTIID